MGRNTKTKNLVLNGIVAALYLALSILVSPIAQGAFQFRISESLNHLVVFNRKLMWGILGGVLIYNSLFSEFGILDVLFGGGQTLLALSLSAVVGKYVANVKIRLALNTLFFTVSMALIAWMLHIAIALPFWVTYGTTAFSEFIVMAISAPVMYGINKKIDLSR